MQKHPIPSKAPARPWANALRAAFPHTIPIMTGFLFLGMTYGIFMKASGFPFWYPMLMSATVFAGSAEFVMVTLLQQTFHPLQVFCMILLINARHLFYGISMLDRYRGMGFKKLYLIFGLCDETFSVAYTAQISENVHRGWFYFFITLLNQSYWVMGATLGGLFGTLIRFNTEGIEFVMTAMFVVIFLNYWMKEKKHVSAVLGIAASAICLMIFGPEQFLLPSMLLITAALALYRPIAQKEERDAA